MAVAVEALTLSQFAAAGLMGALATLLLAVGFSNPLNRGFALFLVLRASVIVTNQMGMLAEGGEALFWERLGQYFFLGVGPAVAYVLVVYTMPRGRVSSRIARV